MERWMEKNKGNGEKEKDPGYTLPKKVNIHTLIRDASMMLVSPSWKREKPGRRRAKWFRGGNITTTVTGGISFYQRDIDHWQPKVHPGCVHSG